VKRCSLARVVAIKILSHVKQMENGQRSVWDSSAAYMPLEEE